jgi:hypothetical protein
MARFNARTKETGEAKLKLRRASPSGYGMQRSVAFVASAMRPLPL